ncbi:hypothetical protein [Streptomyces sp. NPDC126503]|uniref:hypothetical protein n=1 Tax=Streptomyces sp. NPDC126503 TaxID=3155315 RepID=UPI0033231AA9
MAHRVSTLISALSVLPAVMLLVVAVREYRSGASVLWVAAGAVILAATLHALVRDVRRLRAEAGGADR